MSESFIGTPQMNAKIELFVFSAKGINKFNLLILMQIDNAPSKNAKTFFPHDFTKIKKIFQYI